MSSFVVGKEYYVKAAGVVAGIAEAKDLFLYDYKNGRRYDKKGFYNRFVEFYTMNALSVQEQYGDAEPEADDADYMKEFNRAYLAGRNAAFLDPKKLKSFIYTLENFFDCSMYQTEKEAYYFSMKMLYNEISAAFLQLLAPAGSRDGWNLEKLEAI